MRGKKGIGICRRLLCAALTALMLFETSGSALAYLVTGEDTAPTTISYTDAEGNTQTVDESWVESFPYGAFAFETSGLAVTEGESGVIKVYRLGGTTGRATAYLTYEPVLVQGEDGETVYDYAISAEDVDIQVEDPLPRAQYEEVGMPPAPKVGEAEVSAQPDELGYTLQLSVEAEAYQWQILYDGAWEDILDATGAEVPADAEFIDGGHYDYRCIYTLNGVDYCSRSLLGEVYEAPEVETPAQPPEDLDLSAEPTYTALDLRGEGEDPYSGWAFELIFAEGEWVKEIHVDALADALPEAEEAAAFTIWGCDGGEVLESAATMLLRVDDIDEPEASTLGFTVSQITVDKADGTAEVTIERVGGAQKPVTVEYATVDGTALAGRDYAETSGKLMFYAGVTSLPVKVELIDDGVVTDEPVWFEIQLSELLGDDNCQMVQDRVLVELINSGEGAGDNLATQLYDPDAVDVSGSVWESDSAANGGSGAVTGTQEAVEEPEPVYSTLMGGTQGGISLFSVPSSLKTIQFANPSKAWGGTVDLAQKGYWKITKTTNSNVTGLYGAGETTSQNLGLHPGEGKDVEIDKGVALASKSDAWAALTSAGWDAVGSSSTIAGQLLSGYNAELQVHMGNDKAYLDVWDREFLYSYTMPQFFLTQGGRNKIASPAKINRYGRPSGLGDASGWYVLGSDNGQDFTNPFKNSYSGSFSFSGELGMRMDMPYQSYADDEHDELVFGSAVWLKRMDLTRRTFASNAFKVEISTPNDGNTAPEGCTEISDYTSFQPTVEIVSDAGGVDTGSNRLYVGSTIKVGTANAPAGYYVSDLVIYQSRDNGTSWQVFDKFSKSYDNGSHTYTVKTVGTASRPLDQNDLNAQYKFRVCYSRTTKVTVDLTPSVPRTQGNSTQIDTGKLDHVFTGYNGASDHSFSTGTGVGPTITYGYSVFDPAVGDFKDSVSTKTLTKPTSTGSSGVSSSGNALKWSFQDTNVQWVQFDLSPKDMIIINGVTYPGNSKIYLREADFAGGLSVLYYHEDYLTAQSAMSTAISWMAVYWDANGNGKIDGHYATNNGTFVLDPDTDEFWGYIDAGSYNETMFAPKKNSSGQYCQYFAKVCYTMTPRSLVMPQGASADERAQILPAFLTSLNPESAAYSQQTAEQRAYRYIVSGLTKQSETAGETRSSDGHLKYGAEANAPSILDIPLGGDYSPAQLNEDGTAYVWSPNFRGNILYPFAAPEPITITNSVAGATEVTTDYRVARDDEGVITGYTYGETGRVRMNGYLSSFSGTTTFALVTQEQTHTTEEILAAMRPGVSLGGGAAGTDDDTLYVRSAREDYSVRPDSVTLSGCSTIPDAEYLKQMKDSSESPSVDVDMDEAGSELSEFNADLGVDLGSMQIAATDYVTILMDGDKVGFAIGLPIGEVGTDSKGFVDENKEKWTQFNEFFKRGKFFGDESYKKAKTEYDRTHPSPTGAATGSPNPTPGSSTPPAPSGSPAPSPAPNPVDKSKFRAKSFSASLSVGVAILFQYDPLSNDYYFEGMTASVSGALSFRIQFRLTFCPIVYVYFQFGGGIEVTTGLGVIRDAVEVDDPKLDAKYAGHEDPVQLTYMARASSGAVITAAAYQALEPAAKNSYRKADGLEYYYHSAYETFDKARAVYLETGEYFLTADQYGVLTEAERAKYGAGPVGEGGAVLAYYNSRNYDRYKDAVEAYDKATTWSFETDYKAFNLRFSGKVSVDVYTEQDGEWKPAPESSGYVTGFLSSDGSGDTQVTLKKQDGMKLGEKVKVVLRALDYDGEQTMDKTSVTYVAEIQDVRNEVYWQGVSITPSIALEVGAGVGMELLKIELYAKLGLDATFILGVYNPNYDPYDSNEANHQKYEPATVDSFNLSIGLGLRVVLVFFTFEMDAATYNVSYDGEHWTKSWSFFNDTVGRLSMQEGGYQGVTISAPQGTDQKLYTAQDNVEPLISTMAYDPTDKTVPFQLSGYGSSADAANLSTDVLPGGDYKVVSAGGRDFIVYTVSRSGASGEDVSQLVMSELTRTTSGTGEDAGYKYGLADPTGGSGELYIVLDDDGTGDLDFDVWVEESTSGDTTTYTIHAAWVSYATEATGQAQPDEPSVPEYPGMTAGNYDTIAPPTQPVERDYYSTSTITAEEYEALTEDEKALCEEDGSGGYTKYVLEDGYTTIAEAKEAYAAAQATYQTDKTSYDAWYEYYAALLDYDAYIQNRLKNAAKNTVLKAAEWSYTAGADGTTTQNDTAFTPAAQLGGDDNSAGSKVGYVFSPASVGDGSVVFFGSTLTQDDGTAYKTYTDFLDGSPMKGAEYLDYLKSTKKSTLDVLGIQSNLDLAYQTSDGGWAVSSMALAEGQTLSNMEFTQLGSDCYLAYTTRQDAYESDDHITVERLFLRKVTVDPTQSEADKVVTWGEPYLLRMTRDYDLGEGIDGVYSTAGLVSAHDSPYFSNLSFLTAEIDPDKLTGGEGISTRSVGEHTFLLYEMNGATYIILDDSLESITTSGTGTIYPFFVGPVDEDGNKQASGKLEVTIGTDTQGGLFAVYVGSVPNTTNNALYLSAYDADTNTWGDGVMLAMHDMDTHEASIRYDWGDRTADAAYLGLQGTDGLLTEADVEALYGSEYVDDILENLDAYSEDLGDGQSLTFSNVQAIRGVGDELLVVTQGALSELEVASNGTDTVVMPKYGPDGMDSELGMYAISYSKGGQALGQGQISFGQADFSAGSKLYVEVDAVNTGDTAFRGSKEQPITATLRAGGQELASWTITENIRSGQSLMLSGDCAALDKDLQNGDKFTLTLSEYTGGSYSGVTKELDLFTVEELPDLGVEDLEISVAGVSADGQTTTLNVEFVAANRGSAQAQDVYAQFTYADGKDANDENTYSVLPLTNSDLTIDQAKKLEMQTLAANESGPDDLASGILHIYNAQDGNNDLAAGWGRRVSGTIQVPSKVFTMGESEHLELKIELFSAGDKIIKQEAGVKTALHDEYYSANNAQTTVIEAFTNYTAAPSVVIPMGTTTLIPVSAVSSRGSRPAISVTEIDDSTDGLNIGILNFRQSAANGGSVSGVISITPSKAGTGVIHIYDADTESMVAVAFTVTEAADGIDIYNDNGAFTFYNADGSAYDKEAQAGTQSWQFTGVPTWGEGADAETPLRSNLSIGSKDAYFTFRTVAESIDLYFKGTVEVSSPDYPNYQGGTYTNTTGGSKPLKIDFGDNPNNNAYTVTVKVISDMAWFDRMKEEYSGGIVPTPEYDGTNPLFIWSRSFPATASIETGSTTVPLSLYVMDNNGLSYLTINGTRYDAKSVEVLDEEHENGLLWRYDFGGISANGNYDITAADISGNTVSTTLIVDWFNTTASGDANTVPVPGYGADFYLDADKWNGTSTIGKDDIGKLNISFTEESGNPKPTGNTHEVYAFDGSDFTKMSAMDGKFKITGNGIYWTRTVNEDKTWSAKVLYMGKVDESLPQATLTFDESNGRLAWSAYKTGGVDTKITEVTINGYKVNEESGRNLFGTMKVGYNGIYTLTARDDGGNLVTTQYDLKSLALDLSDCTATSTGAWNQARDNGKVDVDLSGATGGTYDAEDSDEANDVYYARYLAVLVPADYDLGKLDEVLMPGETTGANAPAEGEEPSEPGEEPALVWTAIDKSGGFKHTYQDVAAGDYLVVVRDAVDGKNVATMPVTVADDAIKVKTATLNSSSGSAKDGQALVTVEDGNTEGFEFAILYAPDYMGTEPSVQEFLARDTAEDTDDDIVWTLADDVSLSHRAKTFTGLRAGRYLVAVRGIYITADQLQVAVDAAARLAAAEKALADAEQADPAPSKEELDKLKAAVQEAQIAYDEAAKTVQTASAAAYGAESGYWDGAKVVVMTVEADIVPGGGSGSSSGPSSNLSKVGVDENGSVVYTIKDIDKDLTSGDSKNVVDANQQSDVVLKGDGLVIFIPEGTLTKGFDVDRLIVHPKDARDGMVVEYTDLNGSSRILPWCLVARDSVRYIAVGEGDYALVKGSADFRDIAGLWGEEYIDFAARRELFTGTGDGLFSPDMPMTRAMFVTVLWRMAGSPEAEAELTFTDLTDDWYREAVRWAVANGIADGYSDQLFGPGDPVDREQMCVFLCRFLDYLGWTLDLEEEPISFTDGGSISAWAGDHVDFCTRAGLIQGVGGGAFAPQQSASRMEVSTLLARLVTKLVERYCGE